jgi:DNA-binding GntR family transcriptional regulator
MDLPSLNMDESRPIHIQIADRLAAAIEDGTYLPGERFPGENSLIRGYDVSRGTAREALRLLADRGLIRTKAKIGTFVRDDRSLVRKPRRYRRSSSAPFATDVRQAGLNPDIEATTTVVEADPDTAARLSLAPGAMTVRTVYRFLADGAPIQLSVSHEPYNLTQGTPVHAPEKGPMAGQGVVARLDSIGVHIDHVTEEVTVRPPRGTEVADLDIPKGVHVFLIKRTFEAAGRPVEIADIVIPTDRYSLLYRFTVTDDEEDPPTA